MSNETDEPATPVDLDDRGKAAVAALVISQLLEAAKIAQTSLPLDSRLADLLTEARALYLHYVDEATPRLTFGD